MKGENNYMVDPELLSYNDHIMLNGKADQISDGNHTFEELYYHRALLSALVCKDKFRNPWKSRKQDTGDMPEGFFLIGFNTPMGEVRYHFENKYWDLFDIPELPVAGPWDGSDQYTCARRMRDELENN